MHKRITCGQREEWARKVFEKFLVRTRCCLDVRPGTKAPLWRPVTGGAQLANQTWPLRGGAGFCKKGDRKGVAIFILQATQCGEGRFVVYLAGTDERKRRGGDF